ncbi:Vacuolar amino acid transporter 3 [Smittium mucronatum]|uniref:Vacuolar amino acid transporter 3 n=1 Tax=Smittium mucronatum TaxID=133383 RepID=A0A1R0H1U4_9FUNG|nr:Vacuolar amino acid transporter 3 [Smittium mucronatum]
MDSDKSNPDNSHLSHDSLVPENSSPPVGSIPIRLPKNAIGNFSSSNAFQEATNALSETPLASPSSLRRNSSGIWSIGSEPNPSDKISLGLPESTFKLSKSPQVESKISSNLSSNLETDPLLQDPVTETLKKSKGKLNVTFKNSGSNVDSQSDFAGSYEVKKKDAARLLKRHLVTIDSPILSQSQFPDFDNDSPSTSHVFGSLSKSFHKKVANSNAHYSQDESSLTDINSSKLNSTPSSSKKYRLKKSNRNHKDSEADEYDSLLSSGDSVNDSESNNRKVRSKKAKILADPLTLLSGDITHSLYKWQRDNSKGDKYANIRRNRSYSAVKNMKMASDVEFGLPFGHQDINQPGGFRRYYVRQRAISQGRHLPVGMTSSFVDFISLFGHFAGGNYPSDEDESGSELDYDDEENIEYFNQIERDSALRESSSRFASISRDRSSQPRPESKASSKKAFFLLIKAFVGTGVLFLPKSFHNGGLLFSIVLMIVVAYLALHCMLLLVECHSKLKMSYGDIGYHLMGEKVRTVVLGSIVISQIGFCCAYSIFVATNTRFLFNTFTECRMDYPLSFWILIQFLIYIPMSMVRKIKNFSILALVADVFIVMGLGYLFYYDGRVLIKNGISDIKMFNPVSFPLLIGTAVFSFEGIGLVVPVVDSMKTPSDFPKVLSLTVFVSAALFISIASFSYMAFGESVETVILLNLTEGGYATVFIQFLYSLAIIFSVPLQLFPAIRILEVNMFSKSGKRNSMVKWQKNVFRTGLCLFVAALSIFVSGQLDEFVSIIGSFACVPLSFIYPSIFHYYAIETNSRATKIKDIMLFIFGIVTMFYVTHLTLSQWGKGTPPVEQCPGTNFRY